MATLYQRVQLFYLKDRFIFQPKHYNFMGTRLSALWNTLNPGVIPPKVESHEVYGVFMVSDYPEEFVTMIDQLIRNCKKEIIEAANQRREKQLTKKTIPSPSPPLPVEIKKDSSAPSPNKELHSRKRTRKPISKTPVWKSR